jgi:hypothetical protein
MKATPLPWLAPLQKAVRAFFSHDVALRREDGRVQLVLESRPAAGSQRGATRAEQASARELRDLELARTELARVLDGDPSLRSTLRHLAFVEHALEKKGWRGLYKVPRDVLTQALAQLEDLVTNWSAEGLACLRSKMAVAVIEREDEAPAPAPAAESAPAIMENPAVMAARVIEDAMASADDDDAALRAAYEAMGVAVPEAKTAAQITVRGELGAPITIGLRDLSS